MAVDLRRLRVLELCMAALRTRMSMRASPSRSVTASANSRTLDLKANKYPARFWYYLREVHMALGGST
jgi:hypothetical protein